MPRPPTRCSRPPTANCASWPARGCGPAAATRSSIRRRSCTNRISGSPAPGRLRLEDRVHFMRWAGRVMRSVIVDFARRRQAERRGGGQAHITLTTQIGARLPAGEHEILRVHEALDEFAALDARMAQVVELRYFGGMTEAGNRRGAGRHRAHGAARLGEGAAVAARGAEVAAERRIPDHEPRWTPTPGSGSTVCSMTRSICRRRSARGGSPRLGPEHDALKPRLLRAARARAVGAGGRFPRHRPEPSDVGALDGAEEPADQAGATGRSVSVAARARRRRHGHGVAGRAHRRDDPACRWR